MIYNLLHPQVCTHLNTRNRCAKLVSKACETLFLQIFFMGQDLDEVVEGFVFALRENGFLVFIPKYGIKGPVYLDEVR